jgi:predicted DNA-binding transcriptional regulator AlpA
MCAEKSSLWDEAALAAIVRQTAATTVEAVLVELRRRPIVQPEWLSLQDAAAYTGYSEQQFSEYVKRGVAPPSILFSRNARRFKRTDVNAWCAAGGPSQFQAKDADLDETNRQSQRRS